MNAPHTAFVITADDWNRPYSRDQVAFPLDYIRKHKFWSSVGRVDDVFGDKNLICSCPSIEDYV